MTGYTLLEKKGQHIVKILHRYLQKSLVLLGRHMFYGLWHVSFIFLKTLPTYIYIFFPSKENLFKISLYLIVLDAPSYPFKVVFLNIILRYSTLSCSCCNNVQCVLIYCIIKPPSEVLSFEILSTWVTNFPLVNKPTENRNPIVFLYIGSRSSALISYFKLHITKTYRK